VDVATGLLTLFDLRRNGAEIMASHYSFYSFPGYEFLISTIKFLISTITFFDINNLIVDINN